MIESAELMDIDQSQQDLARGLCAQLQRELQAIHEQALVRQFGEWIVIDVTSELHAEVIDLIGLPNFVLDHRCHPIEAGQFVAAEVVRYGVDQAQGPQRHAGRATYGSASIETNVRRLNNQWMVGKARILLGVRHYQRFVGGHGVRTERFAAFTLVSVPAADRFEPLTVLVDQRDQRDLYIEHVRSEIREALKALFHLRVEQLERIEFTESFCFEARNGRFSKCRHVSPCETYEELSTRYWGNERLSKCSRDNSAGPLPRPACVVPISNCDPTPSADSGRKTPPQAWRSLVLVTDQKANLNCLPRASRQYKLRRYGSQFLT